MQGKRGKTGKKLALGVEPIYKFGDNQIKFEDFHQPVGLKLDKNNRWVKKAESIPWEEIEKRYAKLFTNRKGTMIIDANCAPSNIKFPQDTGLLNEARENTEKLIDKLHSPKDGKKPRIYRKAAHKNHLKIARKRKKTNKDIRKSTGQQLGYLRRNLDIIDTMLRNGKKLSDKDFNMISIKHLYEQQKYMRDNRMHHVDDRIVSLSQPHSRPIVRGKAKAKVEFGAKLDISVVDGWTRLEKQSFDAYKESATLIEAIERYKQRTESYPERVLADKIYRNRDNLNFCKELNIHLSGPALGRPMKDDTRNKRQDYIDENERIEVERKFSHAKRKCGMGMIMTKLPETAMHSIAMSIIILNLRRVLYTFFNLLEFLFHFLRLRDYQKNLLFFQ